MKKVFFNITACFLVVMLVFILWGCDIKKNMNEKQCNHSYDFAKDSILNGNILENEKYYYTDNKTLWYISPGNTFSEEAVLKLLDEDKELYYYNGYEYTREYVNGEVIRRENNNYDFDDCKQIQQEFCKRIEYVFESCKVIGISGIKTNAVITEALFITFDVNDYNKMYEKVDQIVVNIFFIENEIKEIELYTKIGTTEAVVCLDFNKFFSENIHYTTIPFFPRELNIDSDDN